MQTLLIPCTFYVFYFAFSRLYVAEAALPGDTDRFENMTLDLALRGSWNLHFCTTDLINCYEMVRGDIVCAWHMSFASACSVQRQRCHDQDGYLENNRPFPLFESFCKSNGYQEWS